MDDTPELVAVCTSCRQLHPDGARCGCVIERAEIVAAEGYELHRMTVPAWRRPKRWPALSESQRQALTQAGLDLVEAIEGAGWRLVRTRGESAHELTAAPTRLGRDVADALQGVPAFHGVEVRWPDAPDWPYGELSDGSQDDLGPGPVVPRYVEHMRSITPEETGVRVPPWVPDVRGLGPEDTMPGGPSAHGAPDAVQ